MYYGYFFTTKFHLLQLKHNRLLELYYQNFEGCHDVALSLAGVSQF